MTQTRKTDMLAEINAAKNAGTTHIWYGHEENAEPIAINDAIADIEQMDEDAIGDGSWGAYPRTTRDGYSREDAETLYWNTYETYAPSIENPDDLETILGKPLGEWTMDEIDDRAQNDAIHGR